MKSNIPAVLAIIAALVTPLSVAAQTILEGRLLAPDGTPHPHELVALESGLVGPGVVDSTRTDADGRFTFHLPEPVMYALGVWAGGSEIWVPLGAGEAGDARRIELEIRREPGRTLDGFSATSSVPIVAALMELYVEAERHHRHRPTSPELEALTAEAESIVDATPLARKAAVTDSLRAIRAALYEELARPRVEAFLAPFDDETRPIMREGYVLWAVDKVFADSARVVLLLQTVSPLSPLWAFEGNSAVGVGNILARIARGLGFHEGETAAGAYPGYVRTLAYNHPDPNVRRQASRRVHQLAVERGDESAAQAAFDRIAREFPGSYEVETIRRSWSDSRNLRPGQPFPSFSFRALEDSSTTVSSADVDASTYLVDFWGSWCAPCIEELPALHALYEEYKPKGFEIVSVATYDTKADIDALRARGYPMPWLHAIVPNSEIDSVRSRYEFMGVPTAILVGPDGVIVAEGEGARGEALKAALADHFREK